ncbi:Kinesin- protein 6 [Cichlidogyrus casuarinus]|uniref:Kinesin-like protein n=1 Tax=Cichlidogyrus casuarinus TaxID=1844966 RepID=A0ABD2QMR7_9PLAT
MCAGCDGNEVITYICGKMDQDNIRIYLRLKPNLKNKKPFQYRTKIDLNNNSEFIYVDVPRENCLYKDLQKYDAHKFKFDHIFDTLASQSDVFERMARPLIDKTIEGFNGTIFAYGQTGSGKTHTITGTNFEYNQRGIIPRSLEYLFGYFQKDLSSSYQLEITYLEIYNDNGYDLLAQQASRGNKLEDLPYNLSSHPANNIEDALNLLFLGDTNRIIAETPMNEASSRSHCIFTLHITRTEKESHNKFHSKLNLVDLAGSERAYKTRIDGALLQETKYINLSLHFLEQVIIALTKKDPQNHVPYRNSMMTCVLRDSLGGNCFTSMIANIATDITDSLESISTCKFSQRVALIKNEVVKNVVIDPQDIISSLRKEIECLKNRLASHIDPSRSTLTLQDLKEADNETNE